MYREKEGRYISLFNKEEVKVVVVVVYKRHISEKVGAVCVQTLQVQLHLPNRDNSHLPSKVKWQTQTLVPTKERLHKRVTFQWEGPFTQTTKGLQGGSVCRGANVTGFSLSVAIRECKNLH
jgi:hypothetical protein